MLKLLYIGAGGFAGCCLRYIISLYSTKIFPNHLPYGTLAVNVLGGILIGFVMGASIKSSAISPNLKFFLITGLLGGLTTFSTFSYETVALFSRGSYLTGMLNASLNIFLSLGGVVLGKYVSQII